MKNLKFAPLVIVLLSVFGLSISMKYDTPSGVSPDEIDVSIRDVFVDTPKTKVDSLQLEIDGYNKLIRDFDTKEKKIKDYEHQITKLKAGQNEIKRKYEVASKGIQKYSQALVGSAQITFNEEAYLVFIADLDNHSINIHWKNNEKKYLNIMAVLKTLEFQKINPLMITNAGMYTPEHNPQGLYIEGGKKHFDLDTLNPKNGTNFYLKPNGVFYVDADNVPHITLTEKFAELYNANKIQVKNATQSGPILVNDGKLHESFTYDSPNRKIRSGVGVINNKKVVFAISKNEVNFHDFATLFKDIFGCRDALFLDGAISMMYLKDLNPNELGGNFGPIISITQKVKK